MSAICHRIPSVLEIVETSGVQNSDAHALTCVDLLA
jgi:hypothetical protein